MNPIEKYSRLSGDILEGDGGNLAFFKGSTEPDVLVLGEAPGPEENKRGIPFVGDCGNELEYLLSESGLINFELAFLNSVFRMPLGEKGRFRKPTDSEIDYYRPMVLEIINFLSPKFILACGNVACYSLVCTQGITRIRGNWKSNIMPTFHPGYTIRNELERVVVVQDMRKIVEALTRHEC